MPSFEQLPPMLQEGLADRAAHGRGFNCHPELMIHGFLSSHSLSLGRSWVSCWQLKPAAQTLSSYLSFRALPASSFSCWCWQLLHHAVSHGLSAALSLLTLLPLLLLWNAGDYLCSISECTSSVSATDTNFSTHLCGSPDSALSLHMWGWVDLPQLASPSPFHISPRCELVLGKGRSRHQGKRKLILISEDHNTLFIKPRGAQAFVLIQTWDFLGSSCFCHFSDRRCWIGGGF